MLIDVIQYAHITRNYEIIGSVLWTQTAAAERLYIYTYIHCLRFEGLILQHPVNKCYYND